MNTINHLSSPLMKGIEEESYVYYVHNYYAELSSQRLLQRIT